MVQNKINVLFLCTANSCRSQMAEAWARSLISEQCVAYSAGIHSHGVNPIAIRVMQEVGIDMDGHFSKSIEMLPKVAFDMCVTVCDTAREACPYMPGVTLTLHHSFPDPPTITIGMNEQAALQVYRAVRDEMKQFIIALPDYFPSIQALTSVDS